MRVSGNSTLVNTAQGMLNSLNNVGINNLGNVSYLHYLIDGSYTFTENGNCETVLVQDLLGYAPPIPESGSFALGAVGLLIPVVLLKLRKRKAKNAPLAV